jgi:hypothetical protein
MAERVGFEPTDVLRHRLISSQVHSTTLPPLRGARILYQAFDATQPRFQSTEHWVASWLTLRCRRLPGVPGSVATIRLAGRST